MLLRCMFVLAIIGLAVLTSAKGADTPEQLATAQALTLNQPGSYRTGLFSLWLEDAHLSFSPEQALASTAWQASHSDNLNFGFSHSAYWLKIPLSTPANHSTSWLLWLQYSLLDRVELWHCPVPVDTLASCQYQQAGDQFPFNNRSHAHPNLIFPLHFDPATHNSLLLLRIETQGTYQLPLTLVDQHTLENELVSENIWRGGFYAVLLVLGLYNLLIFLNTKSRSYLYYSGLVLSFVMFQMLYEGSAFQLLWPNMPELNNYALPIVFALNMLLLSLLVPSFLNLRENQSKIFTLFRSYSALILVSVLMLPLINYQNLVPSYNSFNIVLMGSALVASLYCWITGNQAARYFTLAWAVFFTGLVLADMRSLGLIPANVITLYSYQIGGFFGSILLSLALSDRIIHQQRGLLLAKENLVQSQGQAIDYLHDYEDLYQNSLTGKFQLDSDGYFCKSNASWRAILGYSSETYFRDDNPKFNDLFADNKQRRKFWRKLREHGQLQAQVVSLIQPISGEKVMVSITARKGSTDKAAWYGSGQDITENYLKEQALTQQQQEKSAALRQLVLGITEEIADALHHIRTAENYLDIDEKVNEQNRQIQLTQGLTLVRQGIKELADLSALVKLSMITERQYQGDTINVRQWLSRWCETHNEDDPLLKLRTAVHSYIVEWPTAPEALRLALDQLLATSCSRNPKMHENGELKISVELRERGEFLELHYHDNGKGVLPEDRTALFLPFQANEQGVRSSDLGLYQTYNLLTELMQGFIDWPDEADTDGLYLIVRFNLPVAIPSEDKAQEKKEG